MKTLLLGNGINIQFGGKAYTNYCIMERIKFKARMGGYEELFDNTLSGKEIIGILDNFVDIANDIRNGKYDAFVDNKDDKDDKDIKDALIDFQSRYKFEIEKSYQIMLEDWFFILQMFFLKHEDIASNSTAAIQGFERLVLDAIYNEGKIQELFTRIPTKAKEFFDSYDDIFTLNYDNNIENLIKKQVFHLHGDFSVLTESENPETVLGYIRTKNKESVVVKGMEHCFCNALLNYSGELKYKDATELYNMIVKSNDFVQKCRLSDSLLADLYKLKETNPLEYQIITTIIEHPELAIGTEYYFDKFNSISGELHIIGMSPNNDNHIFNLILNNKSIQKVVFYYFSDDEKKYIETNYSNDLFVCKSVKDLWSSLDCKQKTYNCKYHIPQNIDEFIKVFNALSGSLDMKDDILQEISQTPKFEMIRLCKLVKEDIKKRNPEYRHTSEEEFVKSNASISYIALQEGLLPSTLYMICIMNFKILKDN